MSKDKENSKADSYEVLTGLDYSDRRAEIGDVVSDLPESSIGWLLEQGHVKRVEESESH